MMNPADNVVVSDVANGRMTKAEAFGFSDIAVDHVCRFV